MLVKEMKSKTKKRTGNPLVKAYNNAEFLNGPSGRLIRIMPEIIEPAARFQKYGVRDTIVFFRSSRILPGNTASLSLKKIKTEINRTKSPSTGLQRQYEKE